MIFHQTQRAVLCAVMVIVCLAFTHGFNANGKDDRNISAHLSGDDQHVFRSGLRNSFLNHPLSEKELHLVVAHLRHKTGFQSLRFDEAGFLMIADPSRIHGGSALARNLVLAAIHGRKSIMLQSHNRSPRVVFARVGEPMDCVGARSQQRIELAPIEIDFSDFHHLRGEREAVEAFDPGFVLLHELCHAALEMTDRTDSENAAGDCETLVNAIRRELGLPERQEYRAMSSWKTLFPSTLTARIAELNFATVQPDRHREGRARRKRFSLTWNVLEVGDSGTSLCRR